MQKKFRWSFLLLAAALALGGCSAKEQEQAKVEGLDALGAVQVISREEDSGTRSAFAELTGLDETGDTGKTDGTTDLAEIVSDADAVIEAVQADASAIGYLSMGALDASAGGVKVLSVGGVEGTLENVKNGTYSLERPFLLAWSGELSELEQDFLRYVKGKGQEIVGQSYVAVGEGTSFLSGKQEGTITIHGSTSAAPLLEELAAEYMELNPNARVVVSASDSAAGLNDAIQGNCDFGMASRELKSYEEELLDCQIIARDGIAVIVNEQNPLESVTLENLNGLFSGTIAYWDELNGEE